jgi:hypothetical protein
MGLEYVNRRKKRNFLHQGATKTGKAKYYASSKDGPTRIDRMPDGHEFYEDPQSGIVTVRKTISTRILSIEKTQLETWTRKLAKIEHFLVEIKADSLIVYTPSNNLEEDAREWVSMRIGKSLAAIREILAERASYSAMFRFTLIDEDKRLFRAERWCYRGSIDNWFPLSGEGQTLEAMAREYLPHLAKESFFELM